MAGLAFEHLNLRRNPFGDVPPEQWAEVIVPEVELEPLVEHLKRPGNIVQFIGESGRGKTTHMRAIWHHFPEAPYLYIGPEDRPKIPTAPVVFVDETQRLPWWKREWIFRRRDHAWCIGTHRDHTNQMERIGLDVRTAHVHDVDAVRLEKIVERRLAWARRGPGPLPTLSRDSLEWLLEEFDSDLRGIRDFLYETFQNLDHLPEEPLELTGS